MTTPRRITPYDKKIPLDLWIEFPRADLRRRLIEAVVTIARLRGATSLDVQEALCAAWSVSFVGSAFSRLARDLAYYDLAYFTIQRIAGKQKITLFRLTERGRRLSRSLDVEPIENGWDTLVRTHQGETQVTHAALLLYTDRLARERGWVTELTPNESHQQFYPDLWISTGEWSMYVEVESRWRARSHQWDKWRAALRAQGFVAIVARTNAVRSRLVQSCRAAGVSGVATDLETLRLRGETWWLEMWRAASVSARTMTLLQSFVE
ncbi:hypothetical protein PLCT2_00953 [Planctomycetaceae bacterium]|nr:hypothetical protein PLCT2_00953 [Planctomycetaceae bacterium]